MKTDDTTSGSSGFPTTHWSVVLAAGQDGTPAGDAALGELCRAYWYPIYAFARHLGHPPAEAQDLTQGFFFHLLEKRVLAKVDAARGRFRSFLLGAFRYFLNSAEARATAQKRGGKPTLITLEEAEAENRFAQELADRFSPEAIYDRTWAAAVLDEACRLLEEELQRSGRSRLLGPLLPFLQGDSSYGAYAEAARVLGTTEGTIKVTVSRMRQRYRELLRLVILRTVGSPHEVDEELQHLMAVLRR